MVELKGQNLQDFLDVAVRHHYADRYDLLGEKVVLYVEGRAHQLTRQQVWSYLSLAMYDYVRDLALGYGLYKEAESSDPKYIRS